MKNQYIFSKKSRAAVTSNQLFIITAVFIIFISAVFLIPTINFNLEKADYVKSLEKAYVGFNKALVYITNDMSCDGDLVCTGLFENNTNDKTLGDALIKYFSVQKNCETEPAKGCFPQRTMESYDGSSKGFYDLDDWSGYRFLTNDGVSIYLWNYQTGCQEDYSKGATGNLKQTCGEVYIDVNGPKKGPNMMGRDTFNFWISNGNGPALYPMGGKDTNWGDKDWRWRRPEDNVIQHCYAGEKTGWPCAGRVIEENWQMNY